MVGTREAAISVRADLMTGDRDTRVEPDSANNHSTHQTKIGLIVVKPQTRMSAMVVKIARFAAWLLVVCIVVLTLGPPTVRPVTGFNRDLEHVAAFALLGLAFGLAYPNRRMLLALIGIAIAALMETLQQMVPGRHAYFSDFVINAFGACAGLAVAVLFDWFRRRMSTAMATRRDRE
jgi:VanZ family protein